MGLNRNERAAVIVEISAALNAPPIAAIAGAIEWRTRARDA